MNCLYLNHNTFLIEDKDKSLGVQLRLTYITVCHKLGHASVFLLICVFAPTACIPFSPFTSNTHHHPEGKKPNHIARHNLILLLN